MSRRIAALLRHAEYEQPTDVPSAWLPHPLTERGVAQAREAAAPLLRDCDTLGCRLSPRIECSTTLRAWQTATLLAEALGGDFEVRSSDALSERCLGAAANLSVAQIEEVVARDPRIREPLPENWKSRSDFRLPLPGAESLVDAGTRVAGYLEQVLAEDDADEDRVTLFVGHGASFRHAALALGVLDLDEVRARSMHHCRPVHLERTGPGRWIRVLGDWKLREAKEGHRD